MIFHLGKGKTADDELVREETFRRWREASEKAQSQTHPETAPAGTTGTPRITPAVEEIQMDSMRAVEWPDPRATISLTQEIRTTEETLRSSTPIPRSSSGEQPKSSTSRLAHFVSSGLSALGGSQKPASPAKSNVEMLRTIESTPLEVERRSTISSETPRPNLTSISPTSAPRPQETGVFLDEDIKRRFGTNIRSALGPGTIIEGTFSFDSPVCIEGTLIGDVRSNSALIVGPQATVNARVKVGTLIVFGSVQGDVEAEELVEIKSGGTLEGDVLSQRFALEDGSWFRGRCTPKMSPKSFGKTAVQTEFEETEELDEPLDSFAVSDKWTIGNE